MVFALLVAAAMAAKPHYQVILVSPEPGWDVRFICDDERVEESRAPGIGGPLLRTVFRTSSYACQETVHAATFKVTDDANESWETYLQALGPENTDVLEKMLPHSFDLSQVPTEKGKQIIELETGMLIFYHRQRSMSAVRRMMAEASAARTSYTPDSRGLPVIIVVPGSPPGNR